MGIDTGGTYTDGVLLDYATQEVLSSAKTLTTHGHLARGVTNIIEKLHIPDPDAIELVGISSTLATNSVAEGKIRKTGLILIGYDAELIDQFALADNFAAEITGYFRGGHTSQGAEQAPLELDGIVAWVDAHKAEVEALAVSAYFSPLNASHELAVQEAVSRLSDLPLVLGHQLSTRLDSIKRASTACLNASLVAVMHEFTAAVQSALKERRITAPLMVVKGNGSLMPQEEAIRKPVETVLSGPAASTIGGRFFSHTDNALVIDIGGTTTDMALMKQGRVAVSEAGARVGDITTAVRAAKIRTAVIGCDSRIGQDPEGAVRIGPDRVVPLARLATDFPEIKKDFDRLEKKRGYLWKASDLVYWFLQKAAADEELEAQTAPVRRLFKFLADRPQSLTAVLQTTGVHHEVQLNAEILIRNEYIGVATLTPTDLLHAAGDMDQWCGETAHRALCGFCALQQTTPEKFIETTLQRMVSTITEEALVFLARETQESLPEHIDSAWGRWFFDKALSGEKDHGLSVSIASRFPLIGIGAPAGYFVERVARALNARFILPEYARVANAAGAVVGLIMTEAEAVVYVQEAGEVRKYIVQADGNQRVFTVEAEARAYARLTVRDLAEGKCLGAGAVEPQLEVSETREGPLHRIVARAVGTPGV